MYTIEDIQNKKFSYVSVSAYPLAKKLNVGDAYINFNAKFIVFNTKVNEVREIVNEYILKNLKDVKLSDFTIHIYPKNYIREAKQLFIDGKYIPSQNKPSKILFPLYNQFIMANEDINDSSYNRTQIFPENSESKRLAEKHSISVFTVDGEGIRNYLEVSYILGSHHLVDSFIPENEIWVEESLTGLDREAIIYHELVELERMRVDGWSYEMAHEFATEKEKIFRNENINPMNKEKLTGGKADNLTISDIAKKHNVSEDYAVNQVAKGMLIEREHTNDIDKQREISLDHLTESIEYYNELEKMESKLSEKSTIDIPIYKKDDLAHYTDELTGKVSDVEIVAYTGNDGKDQRYEIKFVDSGMSASVWSNYLEKGKRRFDLIQVETGMKDGRFPVTIMKIEDSEKYYIESGHKTATKTVIENEDDNLTLFGLTEISKELADSYLNAEIISEQPEVKIVSEEIINPNEPNEEDLLSIFERMGEDAFKDGKPDTPTADKSFIEWMKVVDNKSPEYKKSWKLGWMSEKVRHDQKVFRNMPQKDDWTARDKELLIEAESELKDAADLYNKYSKGGRNMPPVEIQQRHSAALKAYNLVKKRIDGVIAEQNKSEISRYDFDFYNQPHSYDKEFLDLLEKFGVNSIAVDPEFVNGIDFYLGEYNYRVFDNGGELKIDNLSAGKSLKEVDFRNEDNSLKTINRLAEEVYYELVADSGISVVESPTKKPFAGTFYQGTENKYKNPYELNKAIEELIDHKEVSGEEYTFEEKAFLTRHSGYGGLDKFGATGISIMYEYFTPEPIVKKMWGLAYKYGFNNDQNVLEPAAGVGRFITFAPDKSKVTALDINPYLVKICKILFPESSIKEMHFERLFLNNNKSIKDKTTNMQQYGLVIGNPPYGKIDGGKWMSMGEDKYTRATNYAEYFISRGLDLLMSGGLLIYIIGAELRNGGKLFLNSGITPAKEKIMEKADLIDAYRLPSDIFERTGVTTEIVILRKK
jgi:uncharacterized protein YkvS